MRSRKHVEVVDFELRDLLVDPLRIDEVEDAVDQLVLIVLAYLVLHVLQDVQDAFHVLLQQLWSQQS